MRLNLKKAGQIGERKRNCGDKIFIYEVLRKLELKA